MYHKIIKKKHKQILVSDEIHEKLKKLGWFGGSFNDVIDMLLKERIGGSEQDTRVGHQDLVMNPQSNH